MELAKIRQSLELTVMSADNLCHRKKKVTKNAFVVVKTNSCQESTTKMPIENGCGTLTWNEKLAIELLPHAGFLSVEVHYKASSGKTKLVGEAKVPVSDFMVGFLPTTHLQLLSYRLSNTEGERSGVINISVRVKGPQTLPYRCSDGTTVPEIGVPMSGGKRFGGVVTGVPAAWYSRPQPWTY